LYVNATAGHFLDSCKLSGECANASAEHPDDALPAPAPAPRATLEAFLYDFFLARLGCALLAEAHLAAFAASLARVHGEGKKLGTFARLLGVIDPLPEVRSC
jgi:hypothetical protein